MSSNDPKSSKTYTAGEILASFYQAETDYMAASPEHQDFNIIGRWLSPSFRSIHPSELPWGGIWEGREGFEKWSKQMAGRFGVLEVMNPEIYEGRGNNSNSLMVLSTIRLVTKQDKKEWTGPLAQAVKMDLREGWINEIRVFWWGVESLNEILEYERK